MDIVLKFYDQLILTPYIYPKSIQEDAKLRQFVSLYFITLFNGYILYFLVAGFSYIFVFDKRLLKHPLILENQILREIKVTCRSIPVIALLTTPCFFLEICGYSKLYDSIDGGTYGWISIPLDLLFFIFFTDFLIYWIHRFLHSPLLYKRLHKIHHLWKITTPFASHAFHPIDGFAQSLPYHIYVFIFPMYKFSYLSMFVLVSIWTVSIHDGDFRVPNCLKSIVNGSAHHTDHHLYYNYNYGQFFTIWDRIGGSFRIPSSYIGDGPLNQILMKQSKNM